MRAVWTELDCIDPKALVEARLQAHHALQWVTRAARANVAPKPDDSHSNLGWDEGLQGLVSRDLVAAGGGIYRCGLSVDRLTLFVAKGSEMLGKFELDDRIDADAATWIDKILADLGLHPVSGITLPYAIPTHSVAAGGRYSFALARPAFSGLAHWFDAADEILEETTSKLIGIGAGPSEVRCWPHHFDIVALLSLETGDAETAAAIGIGMSAGDAYYAQPYFYVSPWPGPAVDALSRLPVPGRWHAQDFIAAVAPAEAVLATSEPPARLREFIDAAVDVSRRLVAG